MKRIAAALLIALIRVLSWLPLWAVRALGVVVGRMAWWLHTPAARISLINIRHCFPSQTANEQRALARESLIHTATTALESGIMWHWREARWQRLLKAVHGEALLKAALEEGKGVLLLVPHLGNWEYLSLYLGRYPFTALYEPPKLPGVEARLVAARARSGTRMLPISTRGLRSVFQALGNNEVVALLPDQVPDAQSGVQAPLFGQPALTMTLVRKLVRKHRPVVLMTAAVRVPGGYCIEYIPAAEDIAHEDEVKAATALNASVEQMIALDPRQYQWEYKRFKRHRTGGPDIYKSPG